MLTRSKCQEWGWGYILQRRSRNDKEGGSGWRVRWEKVRPSSLPFLLHRNSNVTEGCKQVTPCFGKPCGISRPFNGPYNAPLLDQCLCSSCQVESLLCG